MAHAGDSEDQKNRFELHVSNERFICIRVLCAHAVHQCRAITTRTAHAPAPAAAREDGDGRRRAGRVEAERETEYVTVVAPSLAVPTIDTVAGWPPEAGTSIGAEAAPLATGWSFIVTVVSDAVLVGVKVTVVEP